MTEFPKQNYILGLIFEALGRTYQLGGTYANDLVPEFKQAHQALETFPDKKSQQTLILTAALNLITKVEKKTIALIIGDDPITGTQMSHLVRIRMICAEVISLLTTMIEQIKFPINQRGWSGAGAR